MTEEDAEGWMAFNVLGAYAGQQTPWFLTISLVESVKKLSDVNVAV